MKTETKEKKFIEAKAGLNASQRRAVETVEGPVLVLAGPGTGKTQVLTLRVAEILAKTQASPRNILALTFTESAAKEMRRRLVDLIGDVANSVAIYTFHGFTNAVITEAGINYSRASQTKQVDDLARLELIIASLSEVASPLLTPANQPEKYRRDVAEMIGHLKREKVSPNQLRGLVNNEIDKISNEKTKKNGDISKTAEGEIERYRRTLALADVFEKYQQKLAEEGWYDFDDMILFVARAFEDDADLCASYQELYQYVLVDEYQDTNNAQNYLLRLLTGDDDFANLFVVGDDKQSIYRFQGASTANIFQFLEWFPRAEIITLADNYRSFQLLLDTAQELIANNKSLTTDQPKLATAANRLIAQVPTAGKIDALAYATTDKEALGVGEKIHALIKTGLDPAKIAVLYRNNSEAERFIEVFRRIGIPYIESRRDYILYDNHVKILRRCLNVAEDPSDNLAFFFLLHSDLNILPAHELLTLTRAVDGARESYFDFIASSDFEDLKLASAQRIHALRDQVEFWYNYQFNHSLAETVEYILNDSGLLTKILIRDDKILTLERMRVFFNSVKAIDLFSHYPRLRELSAKLKLRERYGLTLSQENGNHDIAAVNLMTAHKSKGLEFDVVFLTGVTKNTWGKDKTRQSIILPPGIIPKAQPAADDIEEERRLFFVAMTRAKRQLTISYAETDANGSALTPSPFIGDIAALVGTKSAEPDLTAATFFAKPQEAAQNESLRKQLTEIVANYRLSPTSINTYFQCPQLFLYQHIYRVPGVRTGAQAYGEAVHHTLEFIGRELKAERAIPSWERARQEFIETLAKQNLGEFETQEYQTQGEKVLRPYLENEVPNWNKVVDVEYNFSPHNVMLDGEIPITGKLDKIERIPGSEMVRVIDYKTGSVQSRNAILGQTIAHDLDYWRQLQFYVVLGETDRNFPYKIAETALTFIDKSGRFKTETFPVDRGSVEEMKQIIRDIRQRLLEQDFGHTPHKKNHWEDDGPNFCEQINELTN